MKAFLFILAIATISCALEPTVQTHRYEIPQEKRKEIFEELGLKFNETLNGFCDEVKKVLEPKVGVAVSNATDIKTEENENSTRTVTFKKCLSKVQEEQKLFQHGFACIQTKRKESNGTYSEEPANCTKLEYRLECCESTVSAECEDYFDDFASFKCAYCFSQGKSHPCNVLDEYKDLYSKAKEKVEKVVFNKTFFNETVTHIKDVLQNITIDFPKRNFTFNITKKDDIEIDPDMSYGGEDAKPKDDVEVDPDMSYGGDDVATKNDENLDPEFSAGDAKNDTESYLIRTGISYANKEDESYLIRTGISYANKDEKKEDESYLIRTGISYAAQ